MVFVNNKKFACESCIKGHRSSSCHHTDRPLFEIKKKGRPVSQCESCRELRQSRRVHSKCNCNNKDEAGPSQPVVGYTKSRRFIPIVPALPNGLKDVLQASQSTASKPPDARQLVESLLNPCTCKSVRKCKCRNSVPSKVNAESDEHAGLTALARAAELFSQEPIAPSSSLPSPPPPARKVSGKPRQISRPNSPNHKRPKHVHVDPPRLELPPIHIPEFQGVDVPTFAMMPPLSEVTSFVDSGCTCGVSCNCPGCTEHRGPEHVSKDHDSCGEEACGHCVDNRNGIALPGLDAGSSYLRQFFARAAALPAPPITRKGMQIDPMDLAVYPSSSLEHGSPFGFIKLPKLECCGGQCGCPNGRCGCGKACDGCCIEHGGGSLEAETQTETETETTKEVVESPPQPSVPVEIPVPIPKSCCCGGK
ncbi:uncharacterized protein BT62DRAFT_535500 [Guyanagaster necrorhizus]|uniref:Copper-fist domain-containing protein n=1 Tax=Guyanagaster necrorhizus TaxID=856835 RepID=A0A9P7W254_9AGAR|nr:uncharacterized protein BT62DRAFT_535500 [Guyanagaster necrorhizus MCA 3950]KAG7450792.1 hypothetical protein BT62DRAFT_535500 [Guyanagaster necrorhizus MCA 3950]